MKEKKVKMKNINKNNNSMNRKQRREYERKMRKGKVKSPQMSSIFCSTVVDYQNDSVQTVNIQPELILPNLGNQKITVEAIGVTTRNENPALYTIHVFHNRVIEENEKQSEITADEASAVLMRHLGITGGLSQQIEPVGYNSGTIEYDIQSLSDVITMIETHSKQSRIVWKEFLTSQDEAA
jgi:hypothetical protein